MSTTAPTPADFRALAGRLAGELRWDGMTRALYATDASVYRETPLAVALPRTEADIRELILFAREHRTSLIPRTAGTSLAGQVVGPGIVVDVSRHFTGILEVNATERWVRVQPGVVRNELNLALRPHGLFFAPETSTQNRAMLGGMAGNNSCGANSLVHGSTREHLLEARALLSDGSAAVFGPVAAAEFAARCEGRTLEATLYRNAHRLLGDEAVRAEIARHFPKPGIHRRNTGYAADLLAACAPFTPGGPAFNFCRLLAGAEGTLAFLTELKLNLVPLPPPEGALVCVHCRDLAESLQVNLVALRHRPHGSELIDRYILECTRANAEQSPNRFFVQGDPGAILFAEFRAGTRAAVAAEADAFVCELRAAGLGFHHPVITGPDQERVWDLRKAALGLLGNLSGDAKPVNFIEDAAVDPADLPAYVADIEALLQRHGLAAVHYGHAGAGELHIKPILNLRAEGDRRKFRTVATEVAALVKQYGGSFSGEHGDGRLRGEFLKFLVGPKNYALFREIKLAWDPAGVFNPGKITETPPMDAAFRDDHGRKPPVVATVLDFSSTGGFLHAAEKCTGSGDCRKSHLMGGTMCPSFMATRAEQDSTRARANILREVLTRSERASPLDSDAVAAVMDLCLSCKACRTECPSNVDVARLKAEWQQQFLDARGVPLRTRLFANFAGALRWASWAPALANRFAAHPVTSGWLKRRAGIAPGRSLPALPATTLRRWHRRHANRAGPYRHGRVHLFCDEFTDLLDADIGIKAVQLLNRLGYEVVIPVHTDSGRAQISKGLLRAARKLAIRNVELLKGAVTAEAPLIGLEPSAILGFRDEYPDLMPPPLRAAAAALAPHALMFEEFIAREAGAGRITSASFSAHPQAIKLHGHCHQKALASLVPTIRALELPANHRVAVIASGCCGMAGSFGYEAEHYAVAQQIGGLVLFPAVRAAPAESIIAAPGTSCRHQIKDGTGRTALHPAEILHAVLAPDAAS